MKKIDKNTLKENASKFHEFWDSIDTPLKTKILTDSLDSTGHASTKTLETVFLGIKPCTIIDIPNEIVTKFGLESKNGYLFNRKLVEKIIKENSDIFGKDTVDDVFDYFKKTELELDYPDSDKNFRIKRGLILGFPRGACETFLEESNTRKQVFGVGDAIIWTSFADDEDSLIVAKRLNKMYEDSGITTQKYQAVNYPPTNFIKVQTKSTRF